MFNILLTKLGKGGLPGRAELLARMKSSGLKWDKYTVMAVLLDSAPDQVEGVIQEAILQGVTLDAPMIRLAVDRAPDFAAGSRLIESGRSSSVTPNPDILAALASKGTEEQISLMLLGEDRLETHQDSLPTVADVLSAPQTEIFDARYLQAIQKNASDVRSLTNLCLLPSNITLAWVDRLREANQSLVTTNMLRLVDRLRSQFDYVFVDCPPSVSLLTESWLALSDHFLAPAKPDYLSIVGIALLNKLRMEAITRGESFARNAGTLVTMKRKNNDNDRKWTARLQSEDSYRRFRTEIPYSVDITRASEFEPAGRTFAQKYPAPLGGIVDELARELMERLNATAVA